jgi:hypothetical protein
MSLFGMPSRLFPVPRSMVIGPFVGVVAGKKAVIEAEFGIDDERSVGIVLDIELVIEIVVENILDHTAEEGNIRHPSGAWHRYRPLRSTRKSGIDVNECGALVPGCLDPFEGDGVVLRDIAAHVEYYIRIAEIDVMVCHCAASERLCQSRYRGAVSYSGLVFDIDETESPEHLLIEPAFLVVQRRTAY